MKGFVGGLGAVLMYLSFIMFYVGGVLILTGMWGLVGTLIGIFIFPLSMIVSIASCFATIWTFIGYVVWFGLIYLMIYYGDN